MTTKKAKPAAGELYTLVVDVLHNGELFKAGTALLGNDEVVRARPELFVRHALGYRAVVAAIAELERVEREEQAEQVRAAAKENPPPPSPARVVALKGFTHDYDQVVAGSIWVKDHPVVQSAPHVFADVLEN